MYAINGGIKRLQRKKSFLCRALDIYGVNVRESILLTDIVCTSFQSCGITNMKRSHQTDYEDKSHQNNEKIMMIIKLFKA